MKSYTLAILVVAALVVSCSAQECPSICPAIYQPVTVQCGTATRNFANRCELNVHNCRNNNECKG